jgi:AcrR family transcriptional regulator
MPSRTSLFPYDFRRFVAFIAGSRSVVCMVPPENLNIVQVPTYRKLEQCARPAYRGRVPRTTLTRDQITRTAIELLDEVGLDGFNMRSLGERLGSAATAVYWHVQSKENLIRLAGDDAWNEIELPDLDALEWRTAATSMAHGFYAMLTRHPWLVSAFGTHLFYGPGKARHDDHSLAVYENAGFSNAEVEQASATVFTFVLGNALGEAASVSLSRRLARGGASAEEQLNEVMAKASEVGMQFPRLRERIERTSDIEYAGAPEKSFEFGLEAILDGFEARLSSGPTQPN